MPTAQPTRKRKAPGLDSPNLKDGNSEDEFDNDLLDDGLLGSSSELEEDDSDLEEGEDGVFSETEDKASFSDEDFASDGNEYSQGRSLTRELSDRLKKTQTKGGRDHTPGSERERQEGSTDNDGVNNLNYKITKDANGNPRYVYPEIDPIYDSDDSDAPIQTNTIGNIPLSFYDSYPHVGYDINGKRVMRPARGEALDALLESVEIPKGWTGLTDPATGKPLKLSQEELEVLRKIQMDEIPEDGYDPYPVCYPPADCLGTISDVKTANCGVFYGYH